MKILLIHNYGQFRGGAETYLESVTSQLKEKGYGVVLYVKDSKTIHSFFDKIKVAFGMFYSPKTEKDLEEIIKKERPDIAQVLNIYPLISATTYRVLKKFKIPIVQRVQDYRFFCPKAMLFREGKVCELCITKSFKYPSILYGCYQNSRLASLMFSLSFSFHQLIGSYKMVDMYLFPTEFVRDFYIKNAKIEKNKTIVIPTFTDIAQLKSEDGVVFKKKDYFLFFGRLSEEKGIIELLDVFKRLPTVTLVAIGDGPLRNKVGQYSYYKNIVLKGFQPRRVILNYIKQAKAVIIPSLWYDVMPNVLIESLSQGTSVIVPKFGVFPELVKKNQGFFYKQGDSNSLKSIIIRVNNGKKTKAVIDDRFVPEKHINKLIRLYDSIL